MYREKALNRPKETVLAVAEPVFLPMLVSSVPTAAAVGLISYASLKPLVSRYREGRLRARQRRHQHGADRLSPDLVHEET